MYLVGIMKVEFSAAFKELAGMEKLTIDLKSPTTVGKLVKIIARQINGFEKYASIEEQELLSAHLNFVREGNVLLPSDLVYNKDSLKVFLPVVGG
jgi:hypothetical protein